MSSTEMSGRTESAAEIAARMGLDTRQSVADAAGVGGGTPVPGTEESGNRDAAASSAGTSNTDTDAPGGPGPIPYSRFAEVNDQLKELKPYEVLAQYGIEPDSAVRLASFEAAYMQDPTGTIASMVDQLDLPDGNKAALKALLETKAAETAQGTTPGSGPTELPAEVKEVVEWVKGQRDQAAATESQTRLDHVVDHWKSLDTKDGIEVPERQRLMYIQQAAAVNPGAYKSLEQLAEAARTAWLEDRDVTLGGAIKRSGPGSPLAVPGSGVPRTDAIRPKNMAEARKLIEADIANGVLPDLLIGSGG